MDLNIYTNIFSYIYIKVRDPNDGLLASLSKVY